MSPQMNEVIANYFKTQPVLKAWLFGSFARGEERPGSDVDILFVSDRSGKPFTLFTHGGMLMDLQELLTYSLLLPTKNIERRSGGAAFDGDIRLSLPAVRRKHDCYGKHNL